MENKQWWIFTFGSGQKYAGHFVKFFGTYGEARSQMFEHYGDKWAFQYSEAEWDSWKQRLAETGRLWMMETEIEVERNV